MKSGSHDVLWIHMGITQCNYPNLATVVSFSPVNFVMSLKHHCLLSYKWNLVILTWTKMACHTTTWGFTMLHIIILKNFVT